MPNIKVSLTHSPLFKLKATEGHAKSVTKRSLRTSNIEEVSIKPRDRFKRFNLLNRSNGKNSFMANITRTWVDKHDTPKQYVSKNVKISEADFDPSGRVPLAGLLKKNPTFMLQCNAEDGTIHDISFKNGLREIEVEILPRAQENEGRDFSQVREESKALGARVMKQMRMGKINWSSRTLVKLKERANKEMSEKGYVDFETLEPIYKQSKRMLNHLNESKLDANRLDRLLSTKNPATPGYSDQIKSELSQFIQSYEGYEPLGLEDYLCEQYGEETAGFGQAIEARLERILNSALLMTGFKNDELPQLQHDVGSVLIHFFQSIEDDGLTHSLLTETENHLKACFQPMLATLSNSHQPEKVDAIQALISAFIQETTASFQMDNGVDEPDEEGVEIMYDSEAVATAAKGMEDALFLVPSGSTYATYLEALAPWFPKNGSHSDLQTLISEIYAFNQDHRNASNQDKEQTLVRLSNGLQQIAATDPQTDATPEQSTIHLLCRQLDKVLDIIEADIETDIADSSIGDGSGDGSGDQTLPISNRAPKEIVPPLSISKSETKAKISDALLKMNRQNPTKTKLDTLHKNLISHCRKSDSATWNLYVPIIASVINATTQGTQQIVADQASLPKHLNKELIQAHLNYLETIVKTLPPSPELSELAKDWEDYQICVLDTLGASHALNFNASNGDAMSDVSNDELSAHSEDFTEVSVHE